MNVGKWQDGILKAVEHVASSRYQEQTWLGSGQAMSSPEELFCELFDDMRFEEYLSSDITGLTPHQKSLGLELKSKMEAFSADKTYFNPIEVLEDSSWHDIQEAARDFLSSFSARTPKAE
jgi:hypothetical protein